jgi:hypothetical protein
MCPFSSNTQTFAWKLQINTSVSSPHNYFHLPNHQFQIIYNFLDAALQTAYYSKKSINSLYVSVALKL